jgi:hypothetical protein
MGKFVDLTGQRFGQVTVVERTLNHICPSGQRKTMWRCLCDCGNEIIATSANLKNGHHVSCGCLVAGRMSSIGKKRKTHGKSNTRLYHIWVGMKSRCLNPHNIKYNIYGGRGIKVCSDWLNSFEEFCDWAMANGYADNLTIDRIDGNGNYEPSNCRWSTLSEQNKNRNKWHWRKGEELL